jgi:hypothetical protein
LIGFDNLGNKGWLGNQMFQYAALRGVASKKKIKWLIPPNDSTRKHNYLLLDTFQLTNCKEINIGYLKNFYPEDQINHFIEPLDRDRKNNHGGLVFDSEVFNKISINTNLEGFFQSEKYFSHIKNSIRQDFKFKTQIMSSAKSKLTLKKDSYFLHIRKKDFTKSRAYHYNLPLSYYQNAINKFDKDRPCLVFSDDIDWCKNQDFFRSKKFYFSNENYTIPLLVKNKKISSNISYPSDDLYLMSQCNGGIIANSSFSWWGAWLQDSNQENHQIVSPEDSFWRGFYSDNFEKKPKDISLNSWNKVSPNNRDILIKKILTYCYKYFFIPRDSIKKLIKR